MERPQWVSRAIKISADSSDSTPSFALLDVQGPVIVTYVYQLVDGEVSNADNQH